LPRSHISRRVCADNEATKGVDMRKIATLAAVLAAACFTLSPGAARAESLDSALKKTIHDLIVLDLQLAEVHDRLIHVDKCSDARIQTQLEQHSSSRIVLLKKELLEANRGVPDRNEMIKLDNQSLQELIAMKKLEDRCVVIYPWK